jgi:hypothetical protein
MRSNDRVHAVARRPPSVFGDNQFPRVRVERGEGGLDRNLYLPGCGRLRPGRRIYRPMPDQEHRPTGSDAGRQALHQLFDGSCHVHVEADNEVVGGSSRRPRRKIGLDPVDAPRDVDSHGVGCRAGMIQSRRGEVDCRDVPPPRRKPECLRAVAAARIDRTSGTQLADLDDQLGVRWPLRFTIAVVA